MNIVFKLGRLRAGLIAALLMVNNGTLAAELVSNGTFDTDLTGWTVEENPTVSSGRLKFDTQDDSPATDDDAVSQNLTTVIGQGYVLTFDYYRHNENLLWNGDIKRIKTFIDGLSVGVKTVSGLYESVKYSGTASYSFIATSTSTQIKLVDDSEYSIISNILIDNVSVDLDAVTAISIISNYADNSSNPAPTALNYIAAGVSGVTTNNLTEINAAINAVSASEADTTGKIQAIVNPIIAVNKIEAYADNGSNPTPTVSDYTAAGVIGVTAGNLAKVNAAVDAVTAAEVDTKAEIQALVNVVVATNIIEAYADNNSNPTPIVSDYVAAGVTGVTAGNLAKVNAAVDAVTAAEADTKAEIQALVNAVIATNIIEAYAASNSNPTPTAANYAAAGVTGVTAGNLAEVNAAINVVTAVEADTAGEIQAIVDSVVAINVIEAYADNNSNPAPTITDYSNAGVFGVTVGNLTDVNAAIDALVAAGADTTAEIQAIVDNIVTVDAISAYADNSSNPVPVLTDYNNAGIVGVTSGNLSAVNVAINAATAAEADTVSEIQAIVDAVNSQIAVNVITAYAESNSNPTPTTTTFIDAGVVGVTSGNIGQINHAIDALSASAVDTLAEIQIVVDRVIALNVIADYADNNGNPKPDISVYSDAGVSGVSAGNLIDANVAIDAASRVEADTLAEIQAIIDALGAVTEGDINETVLDDIAGNADGVPATAEEINSMDGVSGAIAANEGAYAAAFAAANPSGFVDPENPTSGEIQAIIDAVNHSISALAEVLEDSASTGGANNTNGILVTYDQLTVISGLMNVIEINEAAYQLAITEEAGFSNLPAVSQVQEIIDAVNTSNSGLVAVMEDITGNVDGIPATAADINSIAGVSGAISDNEELYADAMAAANPAGFVNPDAPTAEEIQSIVDQVNSDSAIIEVLEDSMSLGGSGNANGHAVTAKQLLMIEGIKNVFEVYEAAYQAVIAEEVSFSNPPTLAEVQAIIDGVNTKEGLKAVLEDSASNGGANNIDGELVSVAQLAAINGLNNVDPASEALYQLAIVKETGFSDPVSVTELQLLIDNVNAKDTDADGITDAIEIGLDPENPLDTDGDGTPDFEDTDSDNDGLLDSEEVGVDPSTPMDSDGDGIPDYVDVDDSGTGGDSDGDGIADNIECSQYPNCPDTDKDGVPDYMDSSTIKYKKVQSGTNGIGSINPIGLLMMGILFLLRIRSVKRLFLVILSTLMMLFSFSATAAEFDKSWYVGAGIGQSELDPKTTNTGYKLDDENDIGVELFAGYDYNKYFSFQLFYADLGEAELKSNGDPLLKSTGTIEYSTAGFSTLWYFWHDANDYTYRRGWQAYLDVGVSSMSNDSNLNYEKDNSIQLHFGGDVEYAWDNGIAARAGITTFDKDASLISIGILKRFGKSFKRGSNSENQAQPVLLVESEIVEPETEAEPATEIVPVQEEPVEEILDDDNDGVANDKDKCPLTRPQASVNADGCSSFQLLLEGIQFKSGSSEISDLSKPILIKAVAQLKQLVDVSVEINAYTDSAGRDDYNMELSLKRAESVREYFISQGVDYRRLFVKGHGETHPIADNATAEGRFKNRRVELNIIE